MSTQILNFKKQEVVMESKEAVEQYVTDFYGHYAGDATQAYNNWRKKQAGGAITERSVKELMPEEVEKTLLKAVEDGIIAKERHESHVKMYEEVKNFKKWEQI